MEELPRLQRQLEELTKAQEQSRQLLQSQQNTIDALTAELRETNQGVVALYSELDDRADQLRAASDLKSRFLSYMSHEFRTPLGSILSVTRILLDRMDGPLTAEQDKQVRYIEKSTAELTEMVNDLLDLARVEAGMVVISPAWFEMLDLFSALRGMFKPMITNSDISLVFIEPTGMPKVFTDHVKLSHILRNLISNALKFTHRGEIRVMVRPEGEDSATFSVSDTGIGIAPENMKALFHDWAQIDSPAQKRLRGSGLGLSLSKRLAELLGGTITAESTLGEGSTFSVTIPLRLAGHEAGHDIPPLDPEERMRRI